MQAITCKISGARFSISDRERRLLEKLDVPFPTVSPLERRRRRLARRNDRNLQRRTSDLSGKRLLSMYPENTPFPVVEKDLWWGDQLDLKQYGRAFDFNRPFFDQFFELQCAVPRPALNIFDNENCEYVNQCGFSKDCYLSFNTDFCEGCLYCMNVLRSRSSMDLLNCENCELCYECSDCRDCYSSSYLANCSGCYDSALLRNCIGCNNCFGSVNLRNKEYYFFNKHVGKHEYEQVIKKFWSNSYALVQAAIAQFRGIVEQSTFPHAELYQCEDVEGDQLRNCKDTYSCFDSLNNRDVLNCTVLSDANDVADFDIGGYGAELCYEVLGSGWKIHNCYYGSNLWGENTNVYYCDVIHACNHCFGCIGLQRAEFCILNRQYSEAEYFELKGQIIRHMRSTGEWGQFFPQEISPFAYNRSLAGNLEPISREEAEAKGYLWEESFGVVESAVESSNQELPEELSAKNDQVLGQTYYCTASGRPYKIQRAELQFYRGQGLPLPRFCPEERYRQRMEARNPWRLWDRTCSVCEKPVKSSFSPERPQRVACKECYQREIAN